jgi:1,4-alpha-glucan branching enzyme
VLLFMGAELGQSAEWDHDRSLDWGLADDAKRTQLQSFLAELGRVYHQRPALWRSDSDPAGFEWLDCGEHDRPVLAYLRRDGSDHVLVVLNLGHEPWDDYRVGVPGPGRYHLRLSTDEARFGGAGGAGLAQPKADAEPAQGRAHSLRLRLPPLGAVVLVPA